MHGCPTRARRLAVVIVLVAGGAALPAVGVGAGDLADPSATTTTVGVTTTTPGDVAAVTTSSTTITTPATLPGDVAAVTTTQPPPPTTGGPPTVGPPTTPTTAATAEADVAVTATVPPGEPGRLATSATVPVGPDEPVSVGQWSTDPHDWSPAVRDLLVAQGVDLDGLATAGAAGDGQIGGLLSNEGCAVNCITAGLAHAVGVGVHLEVTTSVPAFIQIEIVGVGLKFGPPSALVFGATWAHLEPGTTYDAIARAHDAQGNMAVASGTFTTLTRSAEITFTPTVFWFGNDPAFDPFGDHTWQLAADAFLDGEHRAGATGETASSESVLATASALGLTLETGPVADSVIEVAYVGRYVCVDGCGDGGGVFDLDQAVPLGVDAANGSEADHDSAVWWGTIANDIQLDGYPDDVTSWTGHQFTFPLSTFHGEPVGPAVYLTADVTVEVSYVPAG
ncbi:hypothetical protein [Desertimonas flava]|uniref:hypothetical protein n=1 Tax=Desertimonas flava TaxID=2064846 RepID=UPI000E34C165|nr:hypothetical protein [Desertimonas flava]